MLVGCVPPHIASCYFDFECPDSYRDSRWCSENLYCLLCHNHRYRDVDWTHGCCRQTDFISTRFRSHTESEDQLLSQIVRIADSSYYLSVHPILRMILFGMSFSGSEYLLVPVQHIFLDWLPFWLRSHFRDLVAHHRICCPNYYAEALPRLCNWVQTYCCPVLWYGGVAPPLNKDLSQYKKVYCNFPRHLDGSAFLITPRS